MTVDSVWAPCNAAATIRSLDSALLDIPEGADVHRLHRLHRRM